ncbi:MAG: DNA repair and recombination protein RadB [Candidatus Pacearchaeota archaeon]
MNKENKISAGSYDLNKWLYGGYEKGVITTIYGEAGTGKTNFCILAAVSQAKKGYKVIYIDTEGGFSIERVKQLVPDNYEEVLKNILLLHVLDFKEQSKIINRLEKEINQNKISLIIIDGMTMLYRLDLAEAKQNSNNVQEINAELAKQMKILAEIARTKNIAIIITNQVYHDFISEEDFKKGKKSEIKMVGGDILKYWSKCLIELSNVNGKRIAKLIKHRNLKERKLNFIITDSGIKKRGLF